MFNAGKPYAAIRLHDRNDRCWGVADAGGALAELNGLCMRLTRQEALDVASLLNADVQQSCSRPHAPRGRRSRWSREIDNADRQF